MPDRNLARALPPLPLCLWLPLLAGCTDAQADNFIEAIGALLVAFLIAAAVAVLLYIVAGIVSLIVLTIEVALLVLNLTRPTHLTTSAAIAFGALHILTSLGGAAFGVGWMMEQAANGSPDAVGSASTGDEATAWLSVGVSLLVNGAIGAALIASGVHGLRRIAAQGKG